MHKRGPYKKPTEIETDKLCSYGCGQIAKFINGSHNLICNDSPSKCPENKKKNSIGCKKSYSSGNRVDSKTIYQNLPQETKLRMSWNKGNYSAEFVLNGKGAHKLVLIQERGHCCEVCKNTEWLNKPIALELEHIDGNNRNHTKENLLLLCPNCHSTTDTWRGRNINAGKQVTTEELIDALSNSVSIRQALIKVGLTPKGGNYIRCNNLIHGGLVKLANTLDLSSNASA